MASNRQGGQVGTDRLDVGIQVNPHSRAGGANQEGDANE